MASLVGEQLKDTYDSLLKTSDNDALGVTYKEITDGSGNGSNLYLGTGGNVGIGGTPGDGYRLQLLGDSEAGNTLGMTYLGVGASAIKVNSSGALEFGVDASDGSTERMRIDSSGRVAIGTDSPAGTLTVTDGNDGLEIGNEGVTGTTRIFAYDRTANNEINLIQRALTHQFQTNAQERMRIDSSGNVGIGTTSTTGTLLNILNTSTKNEILFRGTDYTNIFSETTNGIQLGITSTGNTAGIEFLTNNQERMRIDSSGNVGIGVTPEAWTVFNPVLRIKNAGTGGGGALAGTGVDNFRMFANTYYDGAYKRLGTGYATQYEQGSGAHVWSTAGSGAADSAITWSESMRIDSSGNVGIGTTPASTVALDIKESTVGADLILGLTAGTGARSQIRSFAQAGSTTSELGFYTVAGGSTFERMRIDSSGKVGIGTDLPAVELDVVGTIRGGIANKKGTYTDGDTTPSVAGISYLRIANTGATTITDFDDAVEGQVIYLEFADSNTTVNRSNAYLSGGTNFTSSANDMLVLFYSSSTGLWHEISRSVNS